MPRSASIGLCLVAALSLGAGRCRIVLPDDPMLDFDVFEPLSWNAAEIVPGTPWFRTGRDHVFGTRDDHFEADVFGDVDIVLRTGRDNLGATVPPPAAAGPPASWPQAVAEPFAAGTPVTYVVAPVDAWRGPAPGALVTTPYWNGLPLLVFAFADLDGDGFVGVTQLDGDALDASIEEAEWEPVGRDFAFGANGLATGVVQIGVGGPEARPARVVLGAAGWAGGFDPGFLGGRVPHGPAVMTRVPFVPEMRPDRVLEGGKQGPPPAAPGALVGVEIRPALAPDPADPRFGEAFTLRLDGSDVTTDVALVRSGAPVRFGAIRRPDPASYLNLPQRPLRPGLDSAGGPCAVEVLQRLFVADDGAASAVALRVVALDRLGDVTEPAAATIVTARVTGPLAIKQPDTDGDPAQETLVVSDAIGASLVVDDEGGALDGPDAGALVLEWSDGAARTRTLSPDPDVDDDGLVSAQDVQAIHAGRGARLGDAAYEPRLDLDANGRVDADDEATAQAQLGATPSVP